MACWLMCLDENLKVIHSPIDISILHYRPLTDLFHEQSSELKMQIGGKNKKSEFIRLKLWRKRKLARGSTKYRAIKMSSRALPHQQVAEELAGEAASGRARQVQGNQIFQPGSSTSTTGSRD